MKKLNYFNILFCVVVIFSCLSVSLISYASIMNILLTILIMFTALLFMITNNKRISKKKNGFDIYSNYIGNYIKKN